MALDARGLDNDGVDPQERQLGYGEIFEDATGPFDQVRCKTEALGPQHTTDPLRFTPFVTGDGVFYPKGGDRASIADPLDGPPYIDSWWPAEDADPDVSF